MSRAFHRKSAGAVAARLLGLALAAWLGTMASGLAQDADPAAGRQLWMAKANCKNCHGWGGHGVPDVPQEPQGLSFRKTQLTSDQFAEVVRCGRPGSDMPYFLSTAWSATAKNCFGISRADIGDQIPNRATALLPEREIASIVAFIFKDFVGKPLPTQEECQEFFGAATTRCNEYPRRQ
jgi:Cytochrome c